MITYVKGDLFSSSAQVITNTVNCVGVMGKGVALEFKHRFPTMFQDYQTRCKKGMVRTGTPYLWSNEKVEILNFPTKRHWNEPSRLEDIEAGLQYLAEHYDELGIQSLAMPALGCGNGGLKWENVKPLIEKYLSPISTLDVYLYEPEVTRTMTKTSSESRKSELDSGSDGMAAQQSFSL